MAVPSLHVFVSSPGDVGQERVIAERVIQRLQGQFGGRVDLEPVLWEHEPLRATGHFQEQITPPAETDIAVFILWSRLGTPLPKDKFQKESGEQYRSGTEWEFENAVRSYEETGTPDLLVYRKTKDPQARLSDEDEIRQRLQQKEALESFISEWFMGEDGFTAAFHNFETPDDFEKRLEEHLRRLIEEHLPEVMAGDAVAEARWHQGSPFRGLQAFEYEHAPVFFGRTNAVGEVKTALETQAADGRAFVLVVGASGSGKSSLVKAGVLPTLTQPGVVEGIGLWRRCTFRPSDRGGALCRGLAEALLSETALPRVAETGFDADELGALLGESPERALAPLRAALERRSAQVAEDEGLATPPAARLVVYVDQMEEIFTLDAVTDADRQTFADALSALARSGLVWVIGSMRSDFFPRCAEVPELVRLKEGAGHYDLMPATPTAIGQMIRQPARAAGLRFEHDDERGISLDEVLLEAAAADPEALPLLEFTLDQLYERRTDDGVLTFAAYEALGGLEGALAEQAEAVYQAQPDDVRATLTDVFQGLVTVESSRDDAATSRRMPRAQVADTPAKDALVDAFVDARLLVTDRNSTGEAVVSVAHEALLREWPRLQQWVEENRAFLQVRARVADAAARWTDEGCPDDLLLPDGQPLAEARGLLDARVGENLAPGLRRYIDASIDRVEQAQRRRRQMVGRALAAFLLVVAGFGLFSYQQWQSAEAQRDDALRAQSRFLADKALEVTEQGQATTAIPLLLEALPEDMSNPDRPYVPEARAALYNALMSNHEVARVQDDFGEAPLAVDSKGQYVAAIRADSTAQIYTVPHLEPVVTLDPGSPINQVQFHPDGSRVAVTIPDSVVQIWSVPEGDILHTLKPEGDGLYTAEFSYEGQALISGGKNGARAWDPDTGEEIARLEAEDGERFTGVWAAPSHEEVVVITENAIIFWDWRRERVTRQTVDEGTRPGRVAFSPTGDHVAIMITIYRQTIRVPFRSVIEIWGTDSMERRAVSDTVTYPIGEDLDFDTTGETVLFSRGNIDEGRQPSLLLETGSANPRTVLHSTPSRLLKGRAAMLGDTLIAAIVQLEKTGGSIALFSKTTGQYKGTVGTIAESRYGFGDLQVAGSVIIGKQSGGIAAFSAFPLAVSQTVSRNREVRRDRYEIHGSRYIAALSGDSLFQYDVRNVDTPTRLLCRSGNIDLVGLGTQIAYSTAGVLAAVCEKQVVLVDAESGQRIRTLPHESRVVALRFTRNGSRLLTASVSIEEDDEKWKTRLWNVEAALVERDTTYHVSASARNSGPIVSLRGKVLWSTSSNGEVYTESVVAPGHTDQGCPLLSPRARSTDDGTVRYTFDSQTCATEFSFLDASNSVVGWDRRTPNRRDTIQVFDATAGALRKIFEAWQFHTYDDIGIETATPNKVVTPLSAAGVREHAPTILVHDIRTGKVHARLDHDSPVSNARIDPSQQYVLVQTPSTVHVWRTDGSYVGDISDALSLKEYGQMQVAAFQKDKPHVILRNVDAGVLYVVDYERIEAVATIPEEVYGAQISDDGSFLTGVTGGRKSRLRLYPLFDSPQALIDTARSRVTRTLTPAERERFFLSPASSADAE